MISRAYVPDMLLSWRFIRIGIKTPLIRSEGIHRTANVCRAANEYVRINHGRLHVFVAQEFLDRANVVPTFQQVGANECLNVWHEARFVNPALLTARAIPSNFL